MPRISVIIRSYNNAGVIEETLTALFAQRLQNFELINVDSGSTDGTVEIIKKFNSTPVQLPASEYKPGRVLNRAIEKSQGDYLVFLNSDATPVDIRWLETLIAPLEKPTVAATFGRQQSRGNARPGVKRDFQRAFGDGNHSKWKRHFFSLANSAIRRGLWEAHPFSEELQFSEDVEWAFWARNAGLCVEYVPEACVVHSHNYTVPETWRRFVGEGEADAKIFPWSAWRGSFLRYALLPYFADVIRDMAFSLSLGTVRGMVESPIYRAAEKYGRYWGFRKGKRQCPFPC